MGQVGAIGYFLVSLDASLKSTQGYIGDGGVSLDFFAPNSAARGECRCLGIRNSPALSQRLPNADGTNGNMGLSAGGVAPWGKNFPARPGR